MSWSFGELKALVAKAGRAQFRAGEVLFHQGDPGDKVYLIRRGLVEIYAETWYQRRRLNLRGRGEVIGEMALLDGEGRSAGALAKTFVEVRTLDRDVWVALLNDYPALVHGLTRQLSQRMRQLQETLSAELEKRERAARSAGMYSIGPFRLVEKLGEGGMGIIYLAVNESNGQQRAVKVLPVQTEEQRARFERECETMARLIHPNIVRIESGGVEGCYGYVAMELLRGETLERRLLRGRLPQSQLLAWFGPALEALGHAHDRGIMHRDIKPGNLFLTLDGVLKVLDFGIARRVTGPELTVDGRFFGTPQYLAPERIGGQSKAHERRSDLYSLGVTLYQAVTGVCPFESEDVAEIFAAHLHRPPVPPSRLAPVSPELDAVILRLLSKDPLRRYASPAQAHEALRGALEGAAAREVPTINYRLP